MAKRPLFQDIKAYIMQKIEEGTYKIGDKIPTEMELAKIFSTSRQTVHKALRDLVLDDIIERFPRSGSFVKEKVAQSSILDLKNISDEIHERGNSYRNELIALKTVRANETIARALSVVRDQTLYMSKMLHRENGVPVRFDVRYIKPTSSPEYIKQDFKEMTPSQFLKQSCPVEKVNNTIEAVMVNKEIQTYLDIEDTEPCLKISRLVTSKGETASYSELYYPSSRYTLNSTFYSPNGR